MPYSMDGDGRQPDMGGMMGFMPPHPLEAPYPFPGGPGGGMDSPYHFPGGHAAGMEAPYQFGGGSAGGAAGSYSSPDPMTCQAMQGLPFAMPYTPAVGSSSPDLLSQGMPGGMGGGPEPRGRHMSGDGIARPELDGGAEAHGGASPWPPGNFGGTFGPAPGSPSCAPPSPGALPDHAGLRMLFAVGTAPGQGQGDLGPGQGQGEWAMSRGGRPRPRDGTEGAAMPVQPPAMQPGGIPAWGIPGDASPMSAAGGTTPMHGMPPSFW